MFAAISAAAGTLLGLAAAWIAALAFGKAPAYAQVACWSGLYSALVGLVRGPDAGFFAGDVLRLVWAGAQAEYGAPHRSERREQGEQPRAWRSVGLLLVWSAGVLLLAWRAGGP